MRDLTKSKALYSRSQKVLAGASTFGKGPDQFAHGITPYALEKGDGAYLWDIDGNKYLDTMMSLGAVTLGYGHPYVNEAIKKQLEKGSSFSLTHRIEVEVAEMLCERIPCAEMVRFGKNGNDVTSVAIRLSRYITGNNHVLFCGYHGWQDWYICQTSMDGGILSEVKNYSHRFNYNDLDGLENLLNEFEGNTACVIMEPTSRIAPDDGYLQGVRNLVDKYQALLIFDEVVTGFRFDRGGYQKISGVTPDFACFSKAMGNGLPISALVGKREFMEKCPEIFYSLTFGGEAISLAASKAVMEVIDQANVPDVIKKNGQLLLNGIDKLIFDHGLSETIVVEGFPCRNVMIFRDYKNIPAADIRTYWIQELAKRNILTAGYHIVSLSHTEKEINILLDNYDEVFNDIIDSVRDDTLCSKLQCPSAKASVRDL
jgi:glutamate-1-semialdehyde 2,1-aminomutase